MAEGSPLQKYVADHPGVAVAAATVTPKGVEREFYACDSDTRFEIGSITKVFTGILLAEAVQDGLCDWDTPLAQVFPRHVPVGFGRKITLQQLATHTSSLPRLPPALYRTAASAQPFATWDSQGLLRALSTSVSPILHKPGSGYAYSNFGFAVLGLAIEKLRNRPYAELAADLTERLGCPEIHLPAGGERMAVGHNPKGQPVPPWDMAAFGPAGALTSNLDGLIKFAQRCLTPLNAPALAETMTRRTRAEKRPSGALGAGAALGMAGVATALALAEPNSFVPLLLLGAAAYLGGPGYGIVPTVAWAVASSETGAPIFLSGERLGIGFVGAGIAQSLRRKAAIQELGVGWHVRKTADGHEILWHNGGTGGFRSFLSILPETGRASIVLAASASSVDSVGLGLLSG